MALWYAVTASIHVLQADLCWVVAVGQDIQQVSCGHKVKAWECTTLALHVVSQGLLADLHSHTAQGEGLSYA